MTKSLKSLKETLREKLIDMVKIEEIIEILLRGCNHGENYRLMNVGENYKTMPYHVNLPRKYWHKEPDGSIKAYTEFVYGKEKASVYDLVDHILESGFPEDQIDTVNFFKDGIYSLVYVEPINYELITEEDYEVLSRLNIGF